MNKHIEISVNINPLATELASDFLINEIWCSGVLMEETHYEDLQIVSEVKDTVKGYLWLNQNKPVNIEQLQSQLWDYRRKLVESGISETNLGSWNLSVKEIEDEEWAHSWKKYWHPMKVSSKIVICPTWEKYSVKDDEIKIDLDPGSAFGTGTHATTRLCVQAIEKYLTPGDKIADIGTGSGILSIAGVKLGAQSAVGVDNDPSVIDVANDNATKNNVSDKITFYEGSAKDVKGQYEVVVANILAHVLIDIMSDLNNLLKPASKLILSGIISEKEQDVIVSAQSYGLKHIETLTEENWVAIVLEK